MTRIGLVGAGAISRAHADALASLGRTVTAVIDPDFAAAERLGREIGAPVFASVEAARAAASFDRAHVLVPPDLHAAVAEPLLRAGVPVLVEKPLAAGPAECGALLAAVEAAPLGVNQNFVHHPAFARLRQAAEGGRFGVARSLACTYHVPLRQLAARQFGHWMFRAPGNILLEQLVHPLSQVVTLAGPVGAMKLVPGKAIEIAPGLPFVASLDALLEGRLPVHLRFAVGESFPFWQVALAGSDGVGIADILNDRFVSYGRTRYMEQVDLALSGAATGWGIAKEAVAGLVRYGRSMTRTGRRSDGFFLSMKGSLGAFHDAVDAGRPPELDGRFGADLVRVCAEMAAIFPQARPRAPVVREQGAPDVVVLGGTGFIGAETVRQLVAAGRRVRVMARGLRNLPAVFDHPAVTLEAGGIGDRDTVARVIGGCPVVVNLAHGGGGADFVSIRKAMLGGAEIVAEVAGETGVGRLIHIGSIASLYLGPEAGTITGATPPDPQAEDRAYYARIKAMCDTMLIGRYRRERLPVAVLRPGLVVGEGTSPFHSGVGLYNSEQHCIGWNDGRNPLPFVLVEDVAAAIVLACFAPGIEGKSYNLVGGVRPTAREYTADLAAVLGRPLRYHPHSPRRLWLADMGKWLVKRAAGREAPKPSLRDFVSRGLAAPFDCSDAEHDLGWRPNADPTVFRARALEVHAAG
jgi:predicted dehydrogenase/nucleoside-diphosphate-sugar epimerase